MNTTVSIHSSKILAPWALAAALIALPAGAETRWIGIKNDPWAGCPLPQPLQQRGWTVRPLFPQPDPGQGVPPLGLRNFCLYEHPGNGGPLTVAELQGLVALDRDCLAVQPVAPVQPVLLQMAAQELEARFLRFAGVAQATPQARPRVRLALLDTAPTSEDPAADADNVSPHGYTLASMARRLTCRGNACVAQVTSRLALGRMSDADLGPPDPIRGGEAGTIGDLAEAIRQEVEAWEALGRRQALILNLSLGWRGRAFGGLESDLSTSPPSVQAVHAALRDAVCRGVTVLAAAGNQSWGPDLGESRGPLLPAAWEARLAPSPDVCAEVLTPSVPAAFPEIGPASYRPLVYAVGGVRARGERLENSRLTAEPRLVAFGDHAVVVGRDGRATAMLTGSSVSTIVAASALAWVRYLLPNLSPVAAMDRLYDYGASLGREAEFPAGHRRPSLVHRVDVGSAARRACRECQGAGCAAQCNTLPGTPTAGLAALQIVPPMSDLLERAFKGAKRLDVRMLPGADPPNQRLFDTNVQITGTGPQPGSNPCTTCVFAPGGGATAAYVQIDPDYRGDLSSAVLQVDGEAYLLGDLTKQEKVVVEGLPSDFVKLQLSFQVGSLSATSLFFVPE